jgi:transmembrane sensor
MDGNEAGAARRRRAGQEAAEWWVLLDSEHMSLQGRAEFVDWLRESSLHVEEMLRIAQVHGALEQFRGWQRVATDEAGTNGAPVTPAGNVTTFPMSARPSPDSFRHLHTVSRHRRTWLGLGLATAAAALAVWLGVFPGSYTVETGQGERREIALSDGSVVKIDPETLLRIRFGRQLRQIDLPRGRARFRVAKNPTRPFLVHADGTVVRAVGTEFGVEHRTQGIVVTVAEGRVAVLPHESAAFPFGSLASGAQPSDWTPANTPLAGGPGPTPTSVVMVGSGQQVTVTRGGSAEGVREVNAESELSWAEGRLTFQNDSVASVVETFNRYNNLQIHVADTTLADRTMSGVFNASDPESFIAFLQSVTSVRVARSGRDITIASGH